MCSAHRNYLGDKLGCAKKYVSGLWSVRMTNFRPCKYGRQ